MSLVLSPLLPPHAEVCATCNCDIDVHIEFIFDTAIDDPEWNNPIDLGDFGKSQ